MGIFDSILKNPSVQQMAFGHLKSIFADGKVKAIVISIDDYNETVIDLYAGQITVHEINDESNTITQRTYGNGTPSEVEIPIRRENEVTSINPSPGENSEDKNSEHAAS